MNSKLWKVCLYIFVCFFAIFLLFPFFKKQYLIRVENQKTKVLKQQIEEQKKKKLDLEKAIKENEDTGNIEKIARDNLNMSEENERIYKFVDKKEDKNGEN